MAQKGYGELIRLAREAAGMERPEDLAPRIKRSATTVRRIEDEETEPSVEQINLLVSALPISAEKLLIEMGVNFNPPDATKLPTDLVKAALRLSPSRLAQLEEHALALVLLEDLERTRGIGR